MEGRRRFILKGATLAAATAATVVNAPNVIAQPKFQWRMATSWPPALDVLQGSAQRFAKIVDEMSGGRLKIQVFAAGELMPAFGVFDAASQGTLEMFNSAAYYWAGKEPAAQWFTAVPLSLTPGPDGLVHPRRRPQALGGDLRRLQPRPRSGRSTDVQMAGWFRKKINSTADFKGLKMRIPGLGGKVVARAGGTVILTPGGEIYTALERGTIDSTEWVGPHDDMKLGLHNAAKYYYYPGWHEPGTTGEYAFNKKAYDSLPADLKGIIDYACQSMQVHTFMEYEWKNTIALQKLKTDFKGKVELVAFSNAILRTSRSCRTTSSRRVGEEPAGPERYARSRSSRPRSTTGACPRPPTTRRSPACSGAALNRGRSRGSAPCFSTRGRSEERPDELRESDDDGEPDQLQRDEGDDPSVDGRRADIVRQGHPAQVEEREPERRRQEGGLQIDADQDPEPDGIEAEVRDQHRRQDRHVDEADLEEVDEEAQDEDHDHHDGEHAVGAKGEPLEKLLDQVVAVEPPNTEAVIPPG